MFAERQTQEWCRFVRTTTGDDLIA